MRLWISFCDYIVVFWGICSLEEFSSKVSINMHFNFIVASQKVSSSKVECGQRYNN